MLKRGSAVTLEAFCSHDRGGLARHYSQQVDLLLVGKLIVIKQIKGLLRSRFILQSNQRILLVRSKEDGEVGLGTDDPDGQPRALQVAAAHMGLARRPNWGTVDVVGQFWFREASAAPCTTVLSMHSAAADGNQVTSP